MRLTQVRVLLVSLVSWQAVFGACPDGYFGPECRRPCRCRSSRTCGPNGDCPGNEECAVQYFGPGCQYADAVSRFAYPKAPEYLRDNDDSTCNKNTGQTSLKLEFIITSIPFFWFRIVATSSEHFKTFDITYTGNSKMTNEKRSLFNNKTVDTFGETSSNMYDFTLKGPVVGQLCSLHISSGFNIAMYGNVSQTSNFEADLTKCGPHNAIDLNVSPYYEDNSCSATSVERWPNPRWKIALPREIYMPNLVVYNRNIRQDLLDGLNIYVYDGKGTITSAHVFHATGSVYTTTNFRRSLAKNLEFFIGKHKHDDERALFLCEVEVLVENTCPGNTYGLACTDTCTCDKSQFCNSVTGACGQLCPNGFYGPTCKTACSDKCIDKTCEDASGICYKCPPGKKGTSCDEDIIVCKPGTYGLTCADCSAGCSDTCDPLTGYCTCKSGFAGKNCSEKVCPENKYGPTCSDTCTCDKSQKCHTLTGACTQICPVGFYGPTCTTACSDHCIDNICEHVSGTCIKCEPGYTGKICDEECTPGTYGSSCRLNCSEGCTEACDKVTGHCDCKADFEGLDCADCKGNDYGPNCDTPCSSSCLNSTCDPKTGKCFACRQGFIGDLCKGCVAHYYGKMCDQMCPETCLNRTCEGVTGVCNSCPEGLTGPICKDNVGALTFTPLWLLLLLLPLALLFCCCLLLLLRRRRKREEPEDAGKQNLPGLTPNKKEGNNKEKPYRFNFYKQ